MSDQKLRRTSRSEYVPVLREVFSNPGVWVEIPTREQDVKHFVQRCRGGGLSMFPPTEFEFTVMDGRPMARQTTSDATHTTARKATS